MLIWQSVLRREGACAITKVMGFKPCGRGHDELVSEEVERAVRDICGKFPMERVIFMVMPANRSFSGILLFSFYFFLLNHFLEAR